MKILVHHCLYLLRKNIYNNNNLGSLFFANMKFHVGKLAWLQDLNKIPLKLRGSECMN